MLGKGNQKKLFKGILPCSRPFSNVTTLYSFISLYNALKRVILTVNNLINICLYMIAASFEKSLQIILVRDVDGKTFWDALSDAISPRIQQPTTTDETALTTFRGVFLDRPLKKGAIIILTWLNPSGLLVSLLSCFY